MSWSVLLPSQKKKVVQCDLWSTSYILSCLSVFPVFECRWVRFLGVLVSMYLTQPLRLHPTEANLNMAQVKIREVRLVIQFTVPCTVSVSTLHPLLLAPWVHTVCPLTFPTGPLSPHFALCWPLWSAVNSVKTKISRRNGSPGSWLPWQCGRSIWLLAAKKWCRPFVGSWRQTICQLTVEIKHCCGNLERKVHHHFSSINPVTTPQACNTLAGLLTNQKHLLSDVEPRGHVAHLDLHASAGW